MCANPDKATTDKFRRKGVPFRAYKVFTSVGRSECRKAQYGPGWCYARKGPWTPYTYDRAKPRGLHVYRTKRAATCSVAYRGYKIVPVIIHPQDIIAAEAPSKESGGNQIVVNTLYISPAHWEAAGFEPMTERCRAV